MTQYTVILLLSSVLLLHASLVDRRPMGRVCKDGEKKLKPGVKFYPSGGNTYASYYNGCGGIEKTFDTYEEAHMYQDTECDSRACPFNAPPTGKCHNANSYQFFDPRLKIKKLECPSGSYCINEQNPQDITTNCCNQTHKDEFEAARAGKCNAGEVAQTIPGRKEVLLGFSGAHKFCQDGARCVQFSFEAYCCVPNKKA